MSRAVAPFFSAWGGSWQRPARSRSSAARSPTPRTGVECEGRGERARGDPLARGLPGDDPDDSGQGQPCGDREGQQDPAGDRIDPAQQHAAEVTAPAAAIGGTATPANASSRVPRRPVDPGEQVAAARATGARPGPAGSIGGEERRPQVGEDAEGAGVDHDPLETARARAHDGQDPDLPPREREVGDVVTGPARLMREAEVPTRVTFVITQTAATVAPSRSQPGAGRAEPEDAPQDPRRRPRITRRPARGRARSRRRRLRRAPTVRDHDDRPAAAEPVDSPARCLLRRGRGGWLVEDDEARHRAGNARATADPLSLRPAS